MSVISIISGSFCNCEEVAQSLVDSLKWPLLRDEDLIKQVSQKNGLSPEVLRRALYGKSSVFNTFSHEKERAVSWLKQGMASLLVQDNLIFAGFGASLLTGVCGHVLSVGLIAETKHRVLKVAREKGLEENRALDRIHSDDESLIRWTEFIHDKDPWDVSLFDMLLPMDKTTVEQACALIYDAAISPQLKPCPKSIAMARDYLLASKVEKHLAEKGHSFKNVAVSAENGKVTISINKKVMMLKRLEHELKEIAEPLEGVGTVNVKPGPEYYHADLYRKVDFKLPSKVLLVDDEREFVQTLSERLLLRDIASAVVYDGKEALRLVAQDEPEVMVLDLKMPGIDGMEVLKRIKEDYPKVEVIILTGHGSERDKETCLQMGAFAYLEKPVDIEKLSQVMKEAYAAIARQQS